MSDICTAVYEIEFTRLYRIQGRILYKLRHLRKQQECYVNKCNELKSMGKSSRCLINRINKTSQIITEYEHQQEILEAEKHYVSKNNPENAMHAEYERIIEEAYRRAYENQQ